VPAFILRAEHHARINDCLWKDGIRLDPEVEKEFTNRVEVSINAFIKERHDSEIPYRDAHRALRDLWLISIEDDPPVGQIRARIAALPKIGVDLLNMRASQVIPEIVETENDGFLSWAKDADPETLVQMIRVISADGAKRVSRSRGRGKRSRARLEPLVFGQARGASAGAVKGGRPRHHPRDDLVMYLAIDWSIATGAKPLPGRSDQGGFGDLVHSVFQWLHEPAPDQALRRYWEAVKTQRSHAGGPGSSLSR